MYAKYSTKLKKVGSSLSREMPSVLWFVSSGSDLQTTGIILQVLCRHYPRRDQAWISWPRLERRKEGGWARTWRSADTEACLGLVWAVGSLGPRPGLNISRSRPPNLCQEAGIGPRRPLGSTSKRGESRTQTRCSLLKMEYKHCDISKIQVMRQLLLSLKNTNVINIDTTCKAALVSARYTRLPVTMRPCEAMLTIWVAADTA